jgi:magnesium-protoporphyrin O-methyltransferase
MAELASPAPADRPERIRTYFEGRAENWIRLTSDAPVSGVRARVRAGRESMAETLLGWLESPPAALPAAAVAGASPGVSAGTGADAEGGMPGGERRVLDAGCGPGEISLRLAARGFRVTGIELAPSLAEAARARVRAAGMEDRVEVLEGDATRPGGGPWDHVVLMDVLFHYPLDEAVEALARLAPVARRSLVFTLAPRTPLLGALRTVGGLFPRRDRAPTLHPVPVRAFVERVLAHPEFSEWVRGRDRFVRSGVYFSHAVELVRSPGGRGDAEEGGSRP